MGFLSPSLHPPIPANGSEWGKRFLPGSSGNKTIPDTPGVGSSKIYWMSGRKQPRKTREGPGIAVKRNCESSGVGLKLKIEYFYLVHTRFCLFLDTDNGEIRARTTSWCVNFN